MPITHIDILRLVQDGRLSPQQGRDLIAAGSAPAAAEGTAGGWTDIAIIGMSGRFPGANDTDAFWHNLTAARDSVAPIPSSRWDAAGFYDPDRSVVGKSYSKWAGLIDDIAGFDADFFNISPREALLMDPQQRLFLQEAWRAIEHAGYAPDSWADRKCGAFVGCVTGDYLTLLRDEDVPVDAYSLTGNTGSILAARLSYFLNLKGPAVAVDTACSSSLVAVHMACESLASGTSDVALAGGAMVFSTPELFIQASRLGMLSPDGVCKTFDNGANGIVLSETVGAVVLKRLADARRDGDTIHAVIRGSGINQDGKTPGITVPSAYAQASLVADVQARAGVHPETIGYIEAHGTGTRLGDPIELEALTSVFRKRTDKKRFCAIGSVKTNIGHAQIAAGVTSLIKAALCLRHGQLPPSLHLAQPNQLIDFDNSPFRMIPSLEAWPPAEGHPRRAGVTSLGFSGTNAHLLLEEYVDARASAAPDAAPATGGETLAVLSARTPERLRAQAARLLRWLAETDSPPALADIVYTLQVGRSAMASRAAFICPTLSELELQLRRFLDRAGDGGAIFTGEARPQADGETVEPLRPARGDDPARVARAWVAGGTVDWAAWHDVAARRRAPLPGYAFADDRYWPVNEETTGAGDAGGLHPLLSVDLSEAGKPRFGHIFDGGEVYLKDHIVSGAPTLLGVSHLEMAIAAEALSRDEARGVSPGKLAQIYGVAWIRPLIVTDRPKAMQIELETTSRGLAYRVGGRGDASGESYSQGRIRFVPAPASAPVLDLAGIKARCAHAWTAEDCYRVFDRNELRYGPGLRTLESLHWSESESLASLVLPEALRGDLSAYTLHPSLMDGALQSLLGLLGDPSADGRLYIPYALNEITVYAPLTARCHAYARVSGNHAASEFAEKRFDIDIVDDDGRVLAAMRELSYRPYSRNKPSTLHMFAPAWRAADLGRQDAAQGRTVVFSARGERAAALEAALGGEPLRVALASGSVVASADERAIRVDPESEADWERLAASLDAAKPPRLLFLPGAFPGGGAASLRPLYRLLRALRGKGIERARLLLVADEDGRTDVAETLAFAGFSRVLGREQPGFAASVLAARDPLAAESARRVARELSCAPAPGEWLVRYRDGARQVRRVERWETPAAAGGLFREGGVYLVTGGAGALGLRIAAEMQRRYGAKVVACGRSSPEKAARAIEQAGLSGLPGAFRYVQADAAKAEDVDRLCALARAEFGAINGVIHAAGAIRDSLIAKQELASLDAVIDPKTSGARLIDEATRSDPLDFMILFSSISSLAGTVGQAAYAFANEYLDHFAERRNALVGQGRRAGRTLSINWPYWRDGGMRIGEQGEILMRSAMGAEPLAFAQGMEVLFGASPAHPSSLCVAAGDLAKLSKTIGASFERAREAAPVSEPARRADAELASLAEEVVRRAPGTIRADAPLADYGFDSITFVELANRINRAYDIDVTPALFFEHKTVAALARHLAGEYGVAGRFEPAAAAVAQASPSAPAHAGGQDRLAETLKALAGEVLKRDAGRFDPATPLADYGFDSITFVELANRINREYDIDVTPALFFEHKTIAALARYLADEHGVAGRSETVAAAVAQPSPPAPARAGGQDRLAETLKALAGEVLKRDAGRFDPATPLADYGFDSITFVELANRINREYDIDVTPALFFEHKTIAALAGHLAGEYGVAVEAARAAAEPAARMEPVQADSVEPPALPAPSAVPRGEGAAEDEPIAIVGMAGVLPGSPDLERFWAHLEAGDDLISEVPPDRWSWQSLYGDPSEGGKTRAKWGGFIEDIDKFDSLYFNISPHEAKLMDPAQRIALEVVYSAIADAGYANAELAGKNAAVYIGVGALDYLNLLVESGQKISAYSSTGLSHSVLANRISYLLDLRGPSQPVDTACSSSLIALHRAVEAIRRHGCDMAIAGGVNVMASPFLTLSFSDAGMLSEDGRCKTFSKRANGYVRGEGAGAVVLKRLSRAEADGDTIHAVIRATAENHGGRASSLTAPNPVAQTALLVDAYSRAGVDPATITYIEAHGTGTPLGDPIEVNALKSAFAELAKRYGPSRHAHRCGIGSVKTNIGHLEAAAGMAGLFKIVLAMKRRALPANLHFDEVNAYVRLEGSPFYVVDRLQPWQALQDEDGRPIPRRAGVSSLSFSGANAHVVLEEYVDSRPRAEAGGRQLIPLSARNRDRLMESARRLAGRLASEPALSLADIAYTLQTGREQLDDRLAIVADSRAALAACLDDILEGRPAAAGIVRFSREEAGEDDADRSASERDDERALAAGDLVALAERWTERPGDKLDWQALPRGRHLRRVPLPAYPFARVRHWAIEPRAASAPQADLIGLIERWHAAAAPAALASAPRVVLCCLSEPAWQTRFAELSAARMPGTRLVFASRQQASPLPGGVNAANPDDPRQLADMCAALVREHGEVDGVLYLWPLEEPALAGRPDVFAALLQALCRAQRHPSRVLAALACRSAIERCRAEAWVGFERSSRQSMPDTDLFPVIVETDVQHDERSMRALFGHVLAEWLASNAGSVLYEDEERLALARERVALPAPSAGGALPSARARTWLITGGGGRLGMLFAGYLARTHGAAVRLALTGRSPLSAELDARLGILRADGAQVRYFQADAASRAEMDAAVREARQAFGPIEAFLHAAGAEEGGTLLEAGPGEFRDALAAKARGAEIVDAVTADDPLVFACYFGSTSALLGDMGAASYSIANRFLMAHASLRNQRTAQCERHGRTVCIGWPLWKEGGMGPVRAAEGSDEARALARYLQSSGQTLLSADVGLPFFESALGGGIEQIALLYGDASRLDRLATLAPARGELAPAQAQAARVERVVAEVAAVGGGENGDSSGDEGQLARELLMELKELASGLSQIPVSQLASHQALNTYGFDSIGLARLARKMQEHLCVPVTPALFFSHPTLGKLAAHLAGRHSGPLLERRAAKAGGKPSAAASPAADGSAARALSAVSAVQPREALPAQAMAEPIAIIGASGRFPQADSIDEMWQTLLDGRDAVSGERAPAGYRFGSLRAPGDFDPLFFGVSPRAAEEMDPRQRLLLEESWRAFEDAAIGPSHLASQRAGVFVGLEEGEYFRLGGGGSITAHHSAITASHLAYLLDFKGPVVTINTACSSGLVALHQACQSLRLGECDIALVGSAHLMLTAEAFTRLDEAGMLSPDGRCHTFDQRANGMAPGEAVAAIVVKKLSAALADGDPVLAVVAGSRINYDGKTNGITAPNGAAQARLLKETYEACGLSPRQIDYVVTHGTGTSLGDAVEVNALAEVFGKSAEGPHCALTSTKTNFGHTLAASGLVSALCLLSALRRGAIPPSLHFETPNSFIDWQDSALFVNREARAWPADDKRPRHGGVSAFGMSGTNAHVVMRDLAAGERRAEQRFQPAPAYLLAFSARSIASLCARARQLVGVLGGDEPLSLSALAHTLFEGRHHFEYRCAIVASDRSEAAALLARLLAARLEPADARSGESDALPAEAFEGRAFIGRYDGRDLAQPAIEQVVESLVRQLGDDLAAESLADGHEAALRALADFYRQGYPIPWRLRYRDATPMRLRLPTYPFDRQHYWARGAESQAGLSAEPSLHPLLHARKSDEGGLAFESSFTGRERVLADHVIHGRRILPGVAYLEMALAAAARALPAHLRAGIRFASLGKIGWMAPFVADEAAARVLETRLEPMASGETGAFAFTISSRSGDLQAATTHCQGVVAARTDDLPAQTLDIAAVRARCPRAIAAEACYAAFEAAGLAYGEGCRAIESVHAGEEECLALLRLPAVLPAEELAPQAGLGGALSAGGRAHALHPALVDGALQAVAGWFLQQSGETDGKLPSSVPFALDSVEVFGPTCGRMWARLTMSGEGAARKLNADLHDEAGRLRVRLGGLSAREIGPSGPDGRASSEPILLSCEWREDAGIDAEPAEWSAGLARREALILDANGDGAVAAELARAMPGVSMRVLPVSAKGAEGLALAAAFEAAAVEVLERARGHLAAGAAKVGAHLLVVAAGWPGDALPLALDGILKTAEQENPGFRGQAFAVKAIDAAAAREIARAAADPRRRAVWIDGGRRLAAAWSVIEPDAGARPIWRDGACYLITGGAGRIGRILARDIVETAPSARVVLVGRSAPGEEARDDLAGLGARVEYRRADISRLDDVRVLVAAIEAAHGRLDGVVHCAGLIEDNFIVNKRADELSRVFAPKVAGAVNLDQATSHLALDLFVLCASASGVTGNVGQADYAAANAFLDGFARHRNALVACGERRGHTLSVDWSLWENGGMRPDPQTEARLFRERGVRPLSTRAALAALRQGLGLSLTQILVAEGDRGAALARFGLVAETAAPASEPPVAQTAPSEPADLLGATVDYFKQLLADIFGLPAHRLHEHEPLERYGIDSIMVVRLTSKLETVFGPLSKTLFFEYRTLGALCGYFVEQHAERLAGVLAPAQVMERSVPVSSTQATAPSTPASREAGRMDTTATVPATAERRGAETDGAFAIIGISGRYPQAADLDAFWENLRTGRDSITEIPSARWNHDRYFQPGAFQPGKTNGKWGGFIDGVDHFDTVFFNISPREAEVLDPQERLFLQCAYHTLEDAGYTRASIADASRRAQSRGGMPASEGAAVGVFVGAMYNEYQLYGAEQTALGRPLAIPGNVASIANRVSYFCDFQGPSMTLDTMCSSSLSAIHLACRSIADGECAFAIAGGVNVTVHPNKYLVLGQGRFLAEDGRCRSFGEGGSGYVPGEGVGAVLIRPLADAIADGDAIHAVICASSVNHGGKTNGYSVPNPNAQAALIADALRRARVQPGEISYVEAHGTGTALGDPIEIAGLVRAFSGRDVQAPCAIGSVKSNIGHAESAAGIAGLSKIVLQMRHRKLAPSLHADTPNPNIDFGRTPFRVQRELADWNAQPGALRVAAISSFGAGGSNAHLIIREHLDDAPEPRSAADRQWLVPLSARTAAQLLEKTGQLLAGIESGALRDFAGIAHTLQAGREAMRERLAFSAASVEELADRLRAARDGWQAIEAGLAEKGQGGVLVWRAPAAEAALYRAKAAAGMPAVSADAGLEAALRGWVGGSAVDWAAYRGGPAPRRVRLPLYPFARERYWAPAALDDAQASSDGTAIFTRTWQPSPSAAGERLADGVLAVLCTPATLAVARRLFSRAAESVEKIYIVHGSETGDASAVAADFLREDSGRAAYRHLAARLAGSPLGVVDVTALDADYEASSAAELGKIALLQLFLADHRAQGPRLLQVTRQLMALSGARSEGLYRMLSAEYRAARAGTMDSDESPEAVEALAGQIEGEFRAGPAAACRYRGGERFAPAMEPVGAPPVAAVYRRDDVVLITGGTGGIGAAVAEHVAKAGVKAIGVIGREALPPAEAWPRLLADGGLSPRARDKVERLQALAARGARVHYQACALDGDDSVDVAVTAVEAALGRVTGVFHCAGLTSADPAFISKPAAQIAAVCEPKMGGLSALYRRLDGEGLRFFMLFSSVSALAPALAAGQSDYAMANAYMDAFARHRHALGDARALSLQWPAWGETGMAVGNAMPAFGRSGLKPVSTAAGLALLDRCVALAVAGAGPAVVAPCCIDAEGFDPAALVAEPERPVAAAVQAERGRETVEPAKAASAPPRAGLLAATETWMREMLISELKFTAEQVADRDVPFSDYGIESVMVLQLIGRMSSLTGAQLAPSLMLEYTTLGELCEHLAAAHESALAGHFSGEAAAVSPEEDNPQARAEADQAREKPAEDKLSSAIRSPQGKSGDIAVIGLAVRLPGAPDVDAFWRLQTSGSSAISTMRDARWPGGQGKVHAGWLDDIDSFDPEHFGLHASDAAVMDPQARLMLEESLKALCDAGYSTAELSGRPVGVYVGGRLQVTADEKGLAAAAHPILGVGQNYLASNISRCFNFTGPSLVVDTACSSGLTGMSLAFDALRGGAIDMALVGATSLLTTSRAHDLFAARNILSPDGAFRIFDRDAAGDVLGEGVVAVVCKTLERAQADGDRIHAVVKALEINNDGRTLGPGSPSMKAQREVMLRALAAAGKRPEDVGYIEVNGGGSAVVDAVEIKALSHAYRLDDAGLAPCPIGSVKPAVGHLLLASGLAGFVRCALSVERGQIAPSLCAERPFEHYDFEASRARFNRETLAWPGGPGKPRAAAQSCFPDGGTNCHLIVEEFVPGADYAQRRHGLPMPSMQRRRFPRAAAPASVQAPSLLDAGGVHHSPIQSSWGKIHEKSV
ncbi:hypothetical protein DK842_05875 [Chromobacterium phragmitis]|uniref:SDR family NAD(P)-dependent oxidoreductase n=1 Tax=Chromobacterium phragmitis TaxID=2202141 RepID=UPI000DEC5DDC|nr:SDR family NAD(P)-dependent oxidoreductase [Chromobacterium phragmitis]AXE29470.1 hypothetical protein DK842_05875 [Chromobacterium phragmitis]